MDDISDVGAWPFRKKKNRNRRALPAAARNGLMRQEPLGLGAVTFTDTSGTALVLTGTPLERFTGRKIVIDVSRSDDTVTGLVTVTSLMVGARNQLPTGITSMPASAWSALASNSPQWKLDACPPSVPITMGVAISAAPAAGKRADVSALIHGIVG